MSTDKLVTKSDLQEFYSRILPYLGGSADAGFTPVGTVISVMGKTAPANYLPCDGRVVNISDYPELADYFKEQFGSANYFGGDGTTTFGIVDLSGEFLRGTGTNSHTNSILGKAEGSGSDVGIHQQATSHRFYQVEFSNSVFGFTNNSGNAGDYDGQKVSGKMKFSTTFTNQTPDPPTGGNYPCYFTSRPTNTSVLFCIATKNIYLNPSLDFSTSEKVVGTWISGKPVYQKTIQIPSSSWKVGESSYTHGIADVDSIWYDLGNSYVALGNNTYWALASANNINNTSSTWKLFTVWVNPTACSISIGQSFITQATSTPSTLYVTLRYTKTTD